MQSGNLTRSQRQRANKKLKRQALNNQNQQGGQRPPANNNRRNNQPTKLGNTLRMLGASVGGLIGQPQLGKLAGQTVSRIFGQGDYQVNAPLKNSLMGVPSFSPLTAGFRVRHREYIGDVSSSIAFASKVYRINPGLATTFPWMSNIAQNFEEYKIHGMVVYLNTMAGASTSGTNSALGLWGVVTAYDPNEPEFQNKQQAEAYVGAQSSVPSQSLLHGIECAPNSHIMEKMYVRSTPIDSTDNLKFYDWGKFTVFTQGSQAVNTIGELWISYDIEFTKPRLMNAATYAKQDRYWGSVTVDGPFGPNNSSIFKIDGSNIGTTLTADRKLTFPDTAPLGVYTIVIAWKMTDAASTYRTPSTDYDATMWSPVKNWQNNAQTSAWAPVSGATANNNLVYVVSLQRTAAVQSVLTFTNGSFSAGSFDVSVFLGNSLVSKPLVPLLGQQEEEEKFDPADIKLMMKFMQKMRGDPTFMKEVMGEDAAESEGDIPLHGTSVMVPTERKTHSVIDDKARDESSISFH